MNPDFSMGEDLLKKTGAGNLFTVFGEPDIEPQRKGKEIVLGLPRSRCLRSNDGTD